MATKKQNFVANYKKGTEVDKKKFKLFSIMPPMFISPNKSDMTMGLNQ